MRNGKVRWFGVLGLLSNAASAFASAGEATESSGAFSGFMLVVGFVLVVYFLVVVVKLMTGSKGLGPDKMTTAEFDDFTRPSDDPSFRFPNSWPRRK